MYIQEITIDGFKSYAQRVTLSNFDPCFNAITGLNGSGKSNILDSICFVLGLKNLDRVRAKTLQELIYKQGAAGISKATVSVTFKNDDPETAPEGYKDKALITITRQIVIGGKNKYLINGVQAQEGRVHDLFASVQLNVNNPTFLIMQGMVTKVLNMKPLEILGMLEEAAGTKMYERKKDSAKKTLDKKQQKLEEIDQVLVQSLQPSLEKLTKSVSDYNEWAALTSTRDRLKRFCVAYDYSTCEEKAKSIASEITTLEAQVAEKAGERTRLEGEVKEQEAAIQELQTEKEIQTGGEAKELTQEVDELLLKLSKQNTALKNKADTLKSEQANLKALQASLDELLATDADKVVADAQALRDKAKADLDAAEHAVEAAGRELAGAEAGDGRDESNRSLQERLADAQNAQTTADAEAKQAEIAAKHLAKQLADQRKQLASKEKESSSWQAELAKAQGSVDEGARRLQSLNFDAVEMARLEAIIEQEAPNMRKAREEVERLSHECAGFAFQYSSPSPNFDHSKVKGVLAKLVRVNEPAASVALEVAAGGKLFQVVVADERTGKELLERGKLQKRVTIIPLNKIDASTLPGPVLKAAEQLGGGKARPALELVGCEAEVEAALKYAFGRAFICQDTGTAKKLAFAREVHTRCITLEGDDFNPSGLLTGGSRANNGSWLTKLHELSQAEARLAQLQSTLRQAEDKLKGMAAQAKEYRKLQQDMEVRQHSLTLLKERMAGSESAQLAAAVADLEAQLQQAQVKSTDAAQRKKEMVELAKNLEREIKDFDKERGTRIKAAQDKLKRAKSDVEARRKALKAAEQELQQAMGEREAAVGEKVQLEENIATCAKGIKALEAEADELKAQVDTAKQEHAVAAARLKEIKDRIKECDKEISGLEKGTSKLKQKVADTEAEMKRMDNKIKAKADEIKKYKERVMRLEKDYPEIIKEKASFGKHASDYDFAAVDPQAMHREYMAIKDRLDNMRNKPDMSVLAKRDQLEAEFKALQEKRKVVEADKEKINKVIEELDARTKVAIKEVWKKVNEDFGSIFSTLLPGTFSKLEPPPGATIEQGLEVKVQFGSVWKESLTELSGGQRSLLALSLILALCRFKPAPLYILDEVDAALDLNHTQNIGRMIREHFPQSQFVIVSLKEGMFNHANVIFRTKFVDGVSTVTRTVNAVSQRGDAGAGKKGGAAPAAAGRQQVLKDSNR